MENGKEFIYLHTHTRLLQLIFLYQDLCFRILCFIHSLLSFILHKCCDSDFEVEWSRNVGFGLKFVDFFLYFRHCLFWRLKAICVLWWSEWKLFHCEWLMAALSTIYNPFITNSTFFALGFPSTSYIISSQQESWQLRQQNKLKWAT